MMKSKRIMGMTLALALTLGLVYTGTDTAKAKQGDYVSVTRYDEAEATPTPEATTTPESTIAPTPTSAATATPESTIAPTPTSSATASKILKLNVTKVNRMAGKSFKLTLSGTTSDDSTSVSFTSDDTKIATVKLGNWKADFSSVDATVKLVKKGKTTIRVKVGDKELTCSIKVVPKMSKADFGMYNVTNFITYCDSHKAWDFVWAGEWGTPIGKYGSTYRGIKIGKSLSDVETEYGELTLKTCKKGETAKKGDPFLYEKKFNTSSKKLKVSKYADLKYGKYDIRVYFTSKNKVFGFIMAKNRSKITKAWLKSDGMSMV